MYNTTDKMDSRAGWWYDTAAINCFRWTAAHMNAQLGGTVVWLEQWFSTFLSPGPILKGITLHVTRKRGHRQNYL